MKKWMISLISICAAGSAVADDTTRITYKSAKSTSSYYQMAVQVSENVKAQSGDKISITVEESQGSVQNVKESIKNRPNYIFTSPPSLIKNARNGVKPFRENKKDKYQAIRALYPIPSVTMHWVVSQDSGVTDFESLKGHDFIIGRGNYAARKTTEVFKALAIDEEVNSIEVELNGAATALKNGKVSGFATSSSFPAPNVLEVASSMPINLISLTPEQLAKAKGTPITIPASTYKGVDYPVQTISLPVGTYAMSSMDDETAYQLTKAFWQARDKMVTLSPWWKSVTVEGLKDLQGPLHPGAERYYRENNIAIPDSLAQ